MKKIFLAAIACLHISAQLALVNAQTVSSTPMPDSTNLIGTAVAIAALIVIFAFIVYAGFRVVKKWSRAQAD